VKPKTITRGPWPKETFDPSTLKIANDPLPPTRTPPMSKYEEVFSKLKPGQCLICEPDHASRIRAALDKWLKNRMKTGFQTKAHSHYPTDRKGRVWLLNKESV
jgi:hypothetical protein